MKRSLLLTALGASLAGCFDFYGLLNECRDGGGACAPKPNDGGSGDDAGVGDGGNVDAGQALCAPGTGATGSLPDGSTAFCFNGFQWENPLPQGNRLYAVGGTGPDDVWAGGTASTLMRWNGSRWQSFQGFSPPTESGESAVTGLRFLPDGGAWLVGRGLEPHAFWDGAWHRTTTVSTDSDFLSALGTSDDGRYTYAASGRGSIRAAPDWQQPFEDWPQPADSVRSIAVTNSGVCLYSGEYWVDPPGENHRFLRACDGGSESEQPVGRLMGPVWVQSGDHFGFSVGPLVYDLAPDGGVDGPIGNANDAVDYLAATWLERADAGFLVGTNTRIWNLITQQAVTIDGVPGPAHELHGVQAFESGDAWAVGSGGALVQKTRGTASWTWRERGFTQDLLGLFVDDQRVIAAGNDSLVYRWPDSTKLTPGASSITDILPLRDGGLLATTRAGEILESGVARYQAGGSSLWCLASPAPGDYWAVGDDSTIVNNGDGGWHVVMRENPSPAWFNADGRDGLVLVVGEYSRIAAFQDGGLAWTSYPDAGGPTFDGVWLENTTPLRAWIAGTGPGVWRLEDTTVTRFDLPMVRSGTLYDVWGFDADDVWAVGEAGLVFHFSGSGWDLVESGTRNNLERVRGRILPNGRRELFIVGQYGTVLRYVY